MPITFTATVTEVREFDDSTVVRLKDESGKYPRFVDAKYPHGEAPQVAEGSEVSVTFKYLPDARGYQSNKENPNTGKPYINAIVVLWKPTIDAPLMAKPTETFEDSIPF